MESAEKLRERCAAALHRSYGRAGAPDAGMDGESLVEALLGSGRHVDIVDEAAERIWVWADLHLWDPAAQRLWRRPEADARALADRMLDEWERAVGPGDLMLCLGDLAHPYGLVDEKLAGRLREAPGRRLLVLGNHDVHRGRMLASSGFDRMCAAAVRAGRPPLIFSHPPLRPAPAGAINVHGHLHRHDPPSARHWNVSVERTGFRPVRLDRLIAGNGNAGREERT